MCFSRRFSSSSSLSFLTSVPLIPEYLFFQLYRVALEMPCSRLTSSAFLPPSYCLRIERICVSVNVFLFIIEQFKFKKLSTSKLSGFRVRLHCHGAQQPRA